MNLTFHIAAALVVIWLVWKLVQAERRRDTLSELLAASRGRLPQRVWVATSVEALRRAADAFAVAFLGPAGGAGVSRPPLRIDLAALAGTFVLLDLHLVRCEVATGGRLVVELHLKAEAAHATEVAARLAVALAVEVQIVPPA